MINPFSFLSMGAGIAGGIMSMIGQQKQFDEQMRLFDKRSAQAIGGATAAQASSGIETIGGASPGAAKFLDTMSSEFARQKDFMQKQFDSSIMAQSVGMALGSAGDAMKGAFQMADLNKVGSTFTPGGGGMQLPAGQGMNLSATYGSNAWLSDSLTPLRGPSFR
jgi:hypothetical protein